MITNKQFFDEISSNYDEMINFDNSLNNKLESLNNFIFSDYKYALDLGCGSGVDSIVLSKLELEVDAVDQSKGMLEQAKINSNKYNVEINFIQSSLADLFITDKSYDLIVSLGNTLANINYDELKLLIAKLYSYLNPNGTILFQLINFAKLPKTGIYLLNRYENDKITIERKYDIHAESIDFIIDKIEKVKNKQSQIITKLYPHSKNDFLELAKTTKLKIELFGNLNKDIYNGEKSQNLIIVLRKL